ncbi:ribonuclease H-like domain-containing protein [Thermovirga lienii]|uniref:ribonuclease H-like domain-containing protein n=1 Tax=Thermovirga lienii TaxID=336261 RepID=UPI002FE1514D
MDRLSRLERLLGPLPSRQESKETNNDIKGLPEGGKWVHEGVYVINKAFPLPYKHGCILLDGVGHSALVLEPWGSKGTPVFLDLETTGLAGGSGTYAFLAGLAYVSDSTLVAKQIFLATPSSEELWLQVLFESFPERDVSLVTYNGKSFDWPMIQTRTILNRKKVPISLLGHLDLLQLVRYLWKEKLENCRLSTVESELLEVQRTVADVPGWLVPKYYADFLKTGNALPLQGVFYHNLMDILSLIALKLKVSKIVSGSDTEDPEATLKAGDLWAARKRLQEAEKLWGFIAACNSHLSFEAKLRLAYWEKKRGNYDVAARLFEECTITLKGPTLINVLIELAKINEHHLKNIPRAIQFTRHALAVLDKARPFYDNWTWKKLRNPILHRLERLIRKSNIKRA